MYVFLCFVCMEMAECSTGENGQEDSQHGWLLIVSDLREMHICNQGPEPESSTNDQTLDEGEVADAEVVCSVRNNFDSP